jgi:hypothetical protein
MFYNKVSMALIATILSVIASSVQAQNIAALFDGETNG